jgi:hypothetical protein
MLGGFETLLISDKHFHKCPFTFGRISLSANFVLNLSRRTGKAQRELRPPAFKSVHLSC